MNCLFCQQAMANNNMSYISYCYNHQQHVQYLKLNTHAPDHFYFKNNAPFSNIWEFSIYNKLNYPNKYLLYCYKQTIPIFDRPQLKLIYQGDMPKDFSPENSQKFVDRLLNLKSFL